MYKSYNIEHNMNSLQYYELVSFQFLPSLNFSPDGLVVSNFNQLKVFFLFSSFTSVMLESTKVEMTL